MKKHQRSITIRDVANLAGVVPSTVSHVLNNTAPVSDATRMRVIAAIQELGYRRNTLASSLRQQTTMMIGLLMPTITEPLYAELAHSIYEEASITGYDVLLGQIDNHQQSAERQLERMLDRRVDGLIVIAGDEHTLQAYQQIHIPVVTLNRQTPRTRAEPPSVEIDNQQAGYIATRHLISLGHTQIGMITTTRESDRYAGYLMALTEAGITVYDSLITTVHSTTNDLIIQGRMAMQGLLKHTTMTACFAVDDLCALGALHAIRDMRLRTPADIAIVGCGDLRLARYSCPQLTTIGYSYHSLGVQAIQMLLNLFQSNPTEARVIIPVELVVRESCGALLRLT